MKDLDGLVEKGIGLVAEYKLYIAGVLLVVVFLVIKAILGK